MATMSTILPEVVVPVTTIMNSSTLSVIQSNLGPIITIIIIFLTFGSTLLLCCCGKSVFQYFEREWRLIRRARQNRRANDQMNRQPETPLPPLRRVAACMNLAELLSEEDKRDETPNTTMEDENKIPMFEIPTMICV
ncbi:hypothetical protein CEXT_30901 [Caerostris extrusa]|uniref:Uncharacterized protein n=1 Tax=Caerostris extrusa TaxID=172846 RepID=A0AAV4XTB8_CAEEX|nr:hypothetical protein CEXT_30901 [Caerostris extrusa]